MADSIRGITVEINADASKFNKQMKALRSDVKESQSELNALQKSLELDFDSTKFEQAQKVAQEAIDKTAQQADYLRQRLAYLEDAGAVDTSEYKSLEKQLAQTELQGQKLQKQLEEINKLKFTSVAKEIEKVGDAITSVGTALTPISALATAALTALSALGLSAVSTADDIATLATQYDVTAEAIQRMQYVALQTDVEEEKLYKSLVKVRAAVADLASGTTSTAATALESLGLALDSYNGTEEQFYAIIGALSDMEDQTQMVALANDIFGDTLANEILPLIYAGSDAIEEYCDEYEELGALTDEQVAKLAEFDNVMNKIKTQLSNIASADGAALLPVMEAVSDYISNTIIPKLQTLTEWIQSLTDSQLILIVKILAVTAALAPCILIIGKLTTAIGGLIGKIPSLISGLNTLAAHPIILIIAAIVAVLVLLYTKCEAFREAINNLVSTLSTALQPVMETISGLISTLMEFLTPLIETVGEILAVVVNLVVNALQPFFSELSLLFELLQPLLSVALIPLQVALTALQVPLQILSVMLQKLSSLFKKFGEVVKEIFNGITSVLNKFLGFVEDIVNGVIDIINKLIKGINSALGIFGISIGYLDHVSLQIDTSDIDSLDDVSATVSTEDSGTAYDDADTSGLTGDTYNYDNSTTNTTQYVTVTIENYASDVDVDDLVKQINIKLAEAM